MGLRLAEGVAFVPKQLEMAAVECLAAQGLLALEADRLLGDSAGHAPA